MKFNLNAALVLALSVTSLYAQDVSKTLKGIQDRYNNAKTMEVNFVQTGRFRNRTTTEKGTLYLSKPKRMLWKYSTPAGKEFVLDGKFIYDYQPGDKQVERTPLKDSDDFRAPLAFLLGNLDFRRDFKNEFRTEADGRITCFAKSDKFPYTEVSFLPGPDFSIRKLTVKYQDGQTSEFVFEGEKRNPLLSDALFHFNPPAGVQVIEAKD